MTWNTASRKRPNAEKLERELLLMRYRNHLRLCIYDANEVSDLVRRDRLIDELDAEMDEDSRKYPQLYARRRR